MIASSASANAIGGRNAGKPVAQSAECIFFHESRSMHKPYIQSTRLALGLLVAAVTCSAQAVRVGDGCDHVVDGVFNGSASSTSDATEWSCFTVAKQFFPSVGVAGGAYLYVDQSGPVLNLMYDYTRSKVAAAFFDVFFEVVPDGHAYLVRIPGSGGLQAYERPIGSIAPLDAGGSFDTGAGSGWDPLTAADLALAEFQGAVGFGSSQNEAADHSMAEFQLTINRAKPGSSDRATGIYDPAPAFWSASAKPTGLVDPPISSGIFSLNLDGTTNVTPVLDASGAPVMQGSVVPEPATLAMCLAGLMGIGALRRASKSKV